MSQARHKEGTDPLMAIMSQYAFNKIKGKSLFLKSCFCLVEGLSVKEIEEIVIQSNAFKIVELEKEGKIIDLDDSLITPSTLINPFD